MPFFQNVETLGDDPLRYRSGFDQERKIIDRARDPTIRRPAQWIIVTVGFGVEAELIGRLRRLSIKIMLRCRFKRVGYPNGDALLDRHAGSAEMAAKAVDGILFNRTGRQDSVSTTTGEPRGLRRTTSGLPPPCSVWCCSAVSVSRQRGFFVRRTRASASLKDRSSFTAITETVSRCTSAQMGEPGV